MGSGGLAKRVPTPTPLSLSPLTSAALLAPPLARLGLPALLLWPFLSPALPSSPASLCSLASSSPCLPFSLLLFFSLPLFSCLPFSLPLVLFSLSPCASCSARRGTNPTKQSRLLPWQLAPRRLGSGARGRGPVLPSLGLGWSPVTGGRAPGEQPRGGHGASGRALLAVPAASPVAVARRPVVPRQRVTEGVRPVSMQRTENRPPADVELGSERRDRRPKVDAALALSADDLDLQRRQGWLAARATAALPHVLLPFDKE